MDQTFAADVGTINAGSLYGSFLYDNMRKLDDAYDFFIEITLILYTYSPRRVGVSYRNAANELDVAACVADTEALYHVQDLFVFLPLVWRTASSDYIWRELKAAHMLLHKKRLDVLSGAATRDESDAAYERFRERVLELFHARGSPALRKYIDGIDAKRQSWVTVLGPLVWTWLHTIVSVTYPNIESQPNNVAGIVVHYVGLIVLCKECFTHWSRNLRQFSSFFVAHQLTEAQQAELALKLIRLHNAIRMYYPHTANTKAYSPKIGNFVDPSETTAFEIFLLNHYSAAGAILSRRLSALRHG